MMMNFKSYMWFLLLFVIQQSLASSINSTELSKEENVITDITTCSNTTIHLFDSGNILSPNYPNNYPVNSYCKWLLKSNMGKRFKLKIKMHYLHYVYENNYILLYNGSTNTNETLLAVLTGYNETLDIVSPTSEILIVFISDNEYRNDINRWFIINYDETLDPPTKILENGEETADKGIIFAPNHNIINGINDYNWTLKSNENRKFKVKVNFGHYIHWSIDYISIYDGNYTNKIAGITNNDYNTEYIFYSDTNQVLINYNFDGSNFYHQTFFNYSSFYIQFEEIYEPYTIEQTSTCEDFMFYDGTQGNNIYTYLYTPHSWVTTYAFSYGNNLSCNWSIPLSPGKRFRIAMAVFAIGKDDVLSIYDGSSAENSSLIVSYTNSFPPYAESDRHDYKVYNFYSETDKFITFTSDYKNSGQGFNIIFTEEDLLN